jgi:hypothetical protein
MSAAGYLVQVQDTGEDIYQLEKTSAGYLPAGVHLVDEITGDVQTGLSLLNLD